MWPQICFSACTYYVLGNFRIAKLSRKDNFVKNIFTNDPRMQYKRCGMVILLWNLISWLSKTREIRENLATQKFPTVYYHDLSGKTISYLIHSFPFPSPHSVSFFLLYYQCTRRIWWNKCTEVPHQVH